MPRVTITVPERKSQPYRFALDRKSVSLGRGSENDIVIDCGSVSVRHAVMQRVKGGYELRDLDSTNGTKLDGRRMEVVPLSDGLSVRIGDVLFDFSLTDDELKTLAGEQPDEPPIIKEKEVEPATRRAPRPAPQPQLASAGNPGAGFAMTLLFLILAAGAFFVGLSVRHKSDTGRPLVSDILNGVPAKEAPAGDAPAEPVE